MPTVLDLGLNSVQQAYRGPEMASSHAAFQASEQLPWLRRLSMEARSLGSPVPPPPTTLKKPTGRHARNRSHYCRIRTLLSHYLQSQAFFLKAVCVDHHQVCGKFMAAAVGLRA